MGQNNKPAKLQIVGGNQNHRNMQVLRDQAEIEDKMRGEISDFEAPEWLEVGSLARRTFNSVKKDLMEKEIVANTDIYTLAMFCDWLQKYVEFRAFVDKEPKDEDGIPNPFINQMDKAAKQVRSFGNDLGMTPAMRSKLAATMVKQQKGDEDEWN